MDIKAALSERLGRLTTAAQRRGIRAPRVLSGPLRAVFHRGISNSADLDDWSRPLIGEAPPAALAHAAEPPAAGQLPAVGPAAVGPPAAGPAGPQLLRCVLVTGSLDVGGMEEVVTLLARLLPGEGFVTSVLHALAVPEAGPAPLGRLGVLLATQHHLTVAALGENEGRRWLEAQAPDVISGHGAPQWALDWACERGVPYVDTLHGTPHMDEIDWPAEVPRSQSLAGVIAVSDIVRRQYLTGNPGFPAEKCRIVTNCVDETRRQPADRDRTRAELGLTNEYLFVCLARFSLQKNVYALVDAFGELAGAFANVHLLIAGRPDDPLYLRQTRLLRDQLGPRDRIHLRDHVTDPGRLLAAGDGFVLDSFFEGGQLVSMEALYAGTPVVLSEAGAAMDQVGGRNTSRGIVVPNPLGDPLKATWDQMRATRFSRQANRPELIDAMSTLVHRRRDWAAMRAELAAESASRFGQAATVRGHAQALSSAARTGSIA